MTPSRAAGGSLIALVVLIAALYWRGRESASGPAGKPLIVYCAASARLPMEAVARDYEAETGQHIELRYGASADLLARAGMVNPSEPADLFLPADESYVRLARDRGLVAEQIPVAMMKAVVMTAKDNPKGLAGWADLLRDGTKVAVPNLAAAVGKLTRDHLDRTGRWPALLPRVVDTGTVTEAANAAKVGSVDAAVVWDAVAAGYVGHSVFSPPELDGVNARVVIARLTQSFDPGASLRFARYVAAPDRGLRHFRAAGFEVVESSAAWANRPAGK